MPLDLWQQKNFYIASCFSPNRAAGNCRKKGKITIFFEKIIVFINFRKIFFSAHCDIFFLCSAYSPSFVIIFFDNVMNFILIFWIETTMNEKNENAV